MKSSRSLRLKKAEKEIRALGETRGVLTSCLISRGSALKRIAAVKENMQTIVRELNSQEVLLVLFHFLRE